METKKLKQKKILVVDSKACTGCETCVFTCRGAKGETISRVRVRSDDIEGMFRPILCIGCIDRPCLFSCPFGAIRFSRRLNIPVINEKKCRGCGACSNICPFEAIIIDKKRKKAFKCDLCLGKPACVEACIPGALKYVPLTKEVSFQKYLYLVSGVRELEAFREHKLENHFLSHWPRKE